MNLLVVGAGGASRRLLQAVGQTAGHTVTHCVDSREAIRVLRDRAPPSYDWVVLTGRPDTAVSLGIARAIRAAGRDIPLSFLSDTDRAGLPLEWQTTSDAARSAPMDSNVFTLNDPAGSAGNERPALVLHYHAAPKKRRLS